MRKFLRFLGICFLSLLTLVALCGALFGYFLYTPDPDIPQLSGSLTKGVIEVGGLKRTYLRYVPRGLAKDAPLVVVMHGWGQRGAQIRLETGYGFDRLADQHGFAVVYPDAYTDYWQDCAKVGDYNARIDDVGFLSAMVDKLIGEIGVDPRRVFATGVSAGGAMSLRLALEAPLRFRAVAAISANMPTLDNSKCKSAAPGASVMIMHGTKDPLDPYDGGEDNLLGIFLKGGNVRSSRDTAQYFADLNKIGAAPETTQNAMAQDVSVEHVLWHNAAKVDVVLVAIHGAGHGLPQQYYRRARLLGPSPMAPDGPAMIWDFFARQRP